MLFIWQKQNGTDWFKDSALENKMRQNRNLCRSAHFKSILILLSLCWKHFDISILETFILTVLLAYSFRQLSKQGAACDCKWRSDVWRMQYVRYIKKQTYPAIMLKKKKKRHKGMVPCSMPRVKMGQNYFLVLNSSYLKTYL